LALWKALKISKEWKVTKINVFGDSMLVIQQFKKAKKVITKESATSSQRILSLVSRFEEVNFFHILWHLNSKADKFAKKGAMMNQSEIEYNQRNDFIPIP